MFHFAWPWMFLLLPLPWLVRYILPAIPPSSPGILFAPFINTIKIESIQRKPQTSNRMIWFGALLCWILLILSAARPQWMDHPLALPETGRNLLMAVDVSGSMQTADLDQGNVTRLDVVKQVAGEFIQRREGDRIGLILFGSQAYLQTPLTFDRITVNTLLDETVIGIAGRETAIGDAIGLAIKRLQGSQGDTVLVLLTDGENTAGNVHPSKAAELAAQQGLRIYTIGVGGEPRAVRGMFGVQVYNPASDLDEETLKTIAKATGGRYFRATDRETLEEVYYQLDKLEPVTLGNRVVRPVIVLYHWPLALSLILSLVIAIVVWKKGAIYN